jgi:hypothetical protein
MVESKPQSQSYMQLSWESVGKAACTGSKSGGNSKGIDASPWRDGGGMSPHHGQGTHRQLAQQSP